MKQHLKLQEEALLERFHCHLQTIDSVDDLFPPNSGVREPSEPPLPHWPGSAALCVESVRKICIANQQREALRAKGMVVLSQIDELLSA